MVTPISLGKYEVNKSMDFYLRFLDSRSVPKISDLFSAFAVLRAVMVSQVTVVLIKLFLDAHMISILAN